MHHLLSVFESFSCLLLCIRSTSLKSSFFPEFLRVASSECFLLWKKEKKNSQEQILVVAGRSELVEEHAALLCSWIAISVHLRRRVSGAIREGPPWELLSYTQLPDSRPPPTQNLLNPFSVDNPKEERMYTKFGVIRAFLRACPVLGEGEGTKRQNLGMRLSYLQLSFLLQTVRLLLTVGNRRQKRAHPISGQGGADFEL